MLPKQDKKKLANFRNMFLESESASSGHKKELEESLKYFQGDQYPDPVRAKAKKEGRGLITANQIFKYLILMSGVERQSRQDIRVFPVGRGSDPMVADLMSLAIKSIDYHTGSPYVRSDMYLSGQISDRAYIKWDLGFRGVYPDIRQSAPDPLDIFEDPNGRSYDFEGHSYVIQRFWIPKSEVITQFGGTDKAEIAKVTSALTSDEFAGYKSFYKKGSDQTEYVAILQVQYKEDEQIAWAFNPQNGDIKKDFDQNNPSELALLSQGGYTIFFDTKKKGKIAQFTSTLILEDMDHYLPDGKFNISRYSPYFVMGSDTSILNQLKSQQDEMNASRSQMNELVSRAPKGTVIYTKHAGISKSEVKNMSALGGVYEVNDLEQIKILETSSYYSALTAFVQLYQFSNAEFQSITGITDVLLGNLKSSTSGVVFNQAVNQASVGLQMGLDNFQRTLVNHYKKLLPMIQKFYPSDKLLKLSNDQYSFLEKASEQQQLKQQAIQTGQANQERQQLIESGQLDPNEQQEPFEIQPPERAAFATMEGKELKLFNQYNEIISTFNDVDTKYGEFDVTVDASKSSFNQQTANLQVMMEILRVVPDLGMVLAPLIVDASPIPNKDLIIEKMDQAQEEAQNNQQLVQQIEFLKDQIKQLSGQPQEAI